MQSLENLRAAVVHLVSERLIPRPVTPIFIYDLLEEIKDLFDGQEDPKQPGLAADIRRLSVAVKRGVNLYLAERLARFFPGGSGKIVLLRLQVRVAQKVNGALREFKEGTLPEMPTGRQDNPWDDPVNFPVDT